MALPHRRAERHDLVARQRDDAEIAPTAVLLLPQPVHDRVFLPMRIPIKHISFAAVHRERFLEIRHHRAMRKKSAQQDLVAFSQLMLELRSQSPRKLTRNEVHVSALEQGAFVRLVQINPRITAGSRAKLLDPRSFLLPAELLANEPRKRGSCVP